MFAGLLVVPLLPLFVLLPAVSVSDGLHQAGLIPIAWLARLVVVLIQYIRVYRRSVRFVVQSLVRSVVEGCYLLVSHLQ